MIPATWSDEFTLKDHINAEVYTNLINLITESEFSQIISSLSTNKASDLSTISYESVKHAGPLCHAIIMKLLNACCWKIPLSKRKYHVTKRIGSVLLKRS